MCIIFITLIFGCSEKEGPTNIDEILALRGWRKEPLDYNPNGPKFTDDVAVAEAYQKNLEKEEEKETQSHQTKKGRETSTTRRGGTSKDGEKGSDKEKGDAMINKWGVDLASLKGAKYIKAEDDTEEIEEISVPNEQNKVNTLKKADSKNNKNNTANKEKQKYDTIIYVAQQPRQPVPSTRSAPNSSQHYESAFPPATSKTRYTKTTELTDNKLFNVTSENTDPPKPTAKYIAWNNNAYEPHMFRNMELAGEHINAIHDIFRPYPVTAQVTSLPKVYHITPKKLN